MKRREQLITVGVIVALAAYVGWIAHSAQGIRREESRLLKKDYAMVYSGARILPLRLPGVADPNNHSPVVNDVIAKQGLQLADLTPAETRFLSLMFTEQGGSSFSDICRYVQVFMDQEGHLPRNAAQIALSHAHPEDFITAYPRLINPSTNRLYDTFEAQGGSLAVN